MAGYSSQLRRTESGGSDLQPHRLRQRDAAAGLQQRRPRGERRRHADDVGGAFAPDHVDAAGLERQGAHVAKARLDAIADAGGFDAAAQLIEERLVRVDCDDARVGQQPREVERLRAGPAARCRPAAGVGQCAHQLQRARGAVAVARTFARQAAVQVEEDAALVRIGQVQRRLLHFESVANFCATCRNFSAGTAL